MCTSFAHLIECLRSTDSFRRSCETTHRYLCIMGLFALGQHKSLVEAQARLSGNERLLAFLDNIYIANMPDRVSEAHTVVEEELSTHAHIHLDHGKTVESWWCGA